MIEYRKGNLMAVTSGIIAHGCNAQGVMGSGVAALVKALYPDAFDQYVADLEMMAKEESYKDISPLGYVSFWSPADLYDNLTPDCLLIANCITQNLFGRDGSKFVSYDAIHTCFTTLERLAITTRMTINIPRIGAGLGGGDWAVIEAIINSVCKESKVICWDLQ